jgi:hypothetical protein
MATGAPRSLVSRTRTVAAGTAGRPDGPGSEAPKGGPARTAPRLAPRPLMG